LKRPTEAEVASARPVKQSKKIVRNPAVATRVVVGASSSKGAAGMKRVAAPIQKCCIPGLRMLAEASSTEPRGLLHENISRPEPATVTRSEPEPPLEITPTTGTSGALFLGFVDAITAG
jgi:hypothetical protein